MCDSCPCELAFRYSFFSSDFSTERKAAAGASIAIGVALAIIFALGIAGIIPGVNAQYPILGLTIGTVIFLSGGFALAGCKPPRDSITDDLSVILDGLPRATQFG